MNEENSEFTKFEQYPKVIQIFQEFDARSVHVGVDFAFLIVKEKEHLTVNEQSIQYYPLMQNRSSVKTYRESHSHRNKTITVSNIEQKDIEQENSLKRVFNLVVFLYEDLRHKLISIVDNHVEIEKILSEDQIDLIKKQ